MPLMATRLPEALPVRYYLRREDIPTERLESSGTQTICAYKGRGSDWSIPIGDQLERDLAWAYPEPLPDAVGIRGPGQLLQRKA